MSGSTRDFEGLRRREGGPSASILILCVLIALPLIPQCQTVPAIGETRLPLIPTAGEIQFGLEADTRIRATVGFYPDQRLKEYLGALGYGGKSDWRRHSTVVRESLLYFARQ
jgi:hypothetical protein